MYKTIASVAIAMLFLNAAIAQNLSHEFGVVSQSDVDFSVYDKDPDAKAVVLFDIGESIFFDVEGNFDIRFTRTKRVKVFSRAGLDQAEVSIPFYVDGFGKTERIRSIEAYSYNFENGKLVKKALDQQKVYEEKINDRWRVQKFAFPDVKEGTIIEYKYVLETPFHFNLPDWEFQDRIPTLYSQYKTRLIPFYDYVFLAQGINKFHFQESKLDTSKRNWGGVVEFKEMIHTFIMKDVPALEDEAYITSPNDYRMKLDFQLAKYKSPTGKQVDIISTWPLLTKELLKHQDFGKYINGTEKLAQKLLETEIKLDQTSELEKSKQIIEYVKANFSWNGYYSKFASKSPKALLNQKTGNSADINLFLTALLNAAGIKAHPVIISTRDHGKIKADYPFLHFFNYVIVMVEAENQAFLTDGTELLVAFNRIPPRCINEKGLVVKETEVTWVNLRNNVHSLDSKNINISVDTKQLSAKAAVMIQSTELEALGYRDLYHNDSTKIKESLLNGGFKGVSRIRTLNYDKISSPYTIAYNGETTVEKIDNKIVVSPFLNFPIKENKLRQKLRSYPVDFIYSKKETFTSVVEVPRGYKVLSVPEEYKLNNELAEISLKYSVLDNVVEANASYHFKKSVYESGEYTRVKEYLDTIVKRFNQQLVFEEL